MTASQALLSPIPVDKPPNSHDIWTIVEILEAILARLPAINLLLCQRVCSGWHRIIESSPLLQRALFLQPKQVTEPSRRVVNPMLTAEHTFATFLRPLSRMTYMPWARTPKQAAFLYRHASWRRMLIAQPPFGVLEQECVIINMNVRELISRTRACYIPDGVRMGYLYDIGEQHLQYKDRGLRIDSYTCPIVSKNGNIRTLNWVDESDELALHLEWEVEDFPDNAQLLLKKLESLSTTFAVRETEPKLRLGSDNEFESQGREQVAAELPWEKPAFEDEQAEDGVAEQEVVDSLQVYLEKY